MLHEILLSLSGHPSPLLTNGSFDTDSPTLLSAPEQELLATAGHLSELHRKLIKHTADASASHPSIICRAVSAAISSIHLHAFQQKILEVEDGILREDAGLVGAYDIVPLTTVVGEFSGWVRRMEWLWDVTKFMLKKRSNGGVCKGAELIDRLRAEVQTGYADIEETALSLVRVAEMTWLKQVSAWVLYGRLPSFGSSDFFIETDESSEQGYKIDSDLLPSFVKGSLAPSMLLIGVSLNRVRLRSATEPSLGGYGHLSSQLRELSSLTFPIRAAALSKAIASIRLTLSRTVLQKLLPLEKVLDMLQLLREFMLLGRGEFAMALTQQADERIRGRWRRADNLAFEKQDGLGKVVVKEGEVTAVLARAWATLGSTQGQYAGEDDILELARELLRLELTKPNKTKGDVPEEPVLTPFRNLLLSVPVDMTIRVPQPLDLFLRHTDVQRYTSINSYLLSIRRAHLRLTDLWKVTRLRRHHLAPPRPPFSTSRNGILKTQTLRERWSARSSSLRSAWTTSSAAIFFLAETEAYLQVEVVEELWTDFHLWLTGQDNEVGTSSHKEQDHRLLTTTKMPHTRAVVTNRDPQSLSTAHQHYLKTMTRHLLLTQSIFTEPLYKLLIQTDHLVALLHRLDSVWASIDLETDEGVVDAFSNLESEEVDVRSSLRQIERKVKTGVEDVVGVLRKLSVDSDFLAEMEEDHLAGDDEQDLYNDGEEGSYKPKRVGGVDRLLMKLDFGGWFDSTSSTGDEVDGRDL